MKTLKESLLDDEDDVIVQNAENAENYTIEQWCMNHLIGFKNYGNVKNRKVNISTPFNESIKIKLGNEGTIPDYIKWGNVSNANFICHSDDIIKSFKNFPSKFNKIEFLTNIENLPKDFTSWNEKIQANLFTMNDVKTLKGLKGKINRLGLYCNELLEFNSSGLTVGIMTCDWEYDYKLKSFDNLPKITDRFEITFDEKVEPIVEKANIKKPNKLTFDLNKLYAPTFIQKIFNS